LRIVTFRNLELWCGPMELVCDNSELSGIWGAEAPDILVIGGYAIRRDMTVGLLDRVKAFKTKHGLEHA
jgi:hypothetical protein